MLTIQQSHQVHKLIPNLVPCTIHHSAPLKISKRYWSPSTDCDKRTQTSFLRGRKLKGRTLKLPKGYQGLLLQKTDRDAFQSARPVAPTAPVEDIMNDIDGVDEQEEEVKVMEQKAVFDEIVVWGHEVVPEDGDEYIKGVEEWIAFAEAMHTDKPLQRVEQDETTRTLK